MCVDNLWITFDNICEVLNELRKNEDFDRDLFEDKLMSAYHVLVSIKNKTGMSDKATLKWVWRSKMFHSKVESLYPGMSIDYLNLLSRAIPREFCFFYKLLISIGDFVSA